MKKLLVLILVLATLLSFTACGRENPEPPTEESSEAETPVSEVPSSEEEPQEPVKGSMKNPYLLDEEIVFESCFWSDKEYGFTNTMVIGKLYGEDESKVRDFYNDRYSGETGSNTFFTIKFDIASEDGMFSEARHTRQDYTSFFVIKVHTADMGENDVVYFGKNQSNEIEQFRSEVEYDIYFTPRYEYQNDFDYQYAYLSITFSTPTEQQKTIWVKVQ